MTSLEVAGIDLSLTSTGIARACWTTCDDVTLMYPFTCRVESKGGKEDTLTQRGDRLDRLAETIVDEVQSATLVVIEGPSLGQQRQGGTHDRSGLWWLVVDCLMRGSSAFIVEVPPACRAMYATGKGNAAKDHVLAAAIRRYPDWDVTGNDVADAVVLAAMGARAIGRPIDDPMPQAHLKAMAKVRWPDSLPTQQEARS